MDPSAIEHAKFRLTKAEEAERRLRLDRSITATRSAWLDFLLAANGIYSKLEQGAKVSSTSQGWFCRIKKEQKSDMLLGYLHQARNAEEHGIQEITSAGTQTLYEMPDGTYSGWGVTGDIKVLDVQITHNGRQISLQNPQVEVFLTLTTIIDGRSRKRFDRPTSHLGQDHWIVEPYQAAGLAIIYLRNLLLAAEVHLSLS